MEVYVPVWMVTLIQALQNALLVIVPAERALDRLIVALPAQLEATDISLMAHVSVTPDIMMTARVLLVKLAILHARRALHLLLTA
jgi:hypothetical protein